MRNLLFLLLLLLSFSGDVNAQGNPGDYWQQQVDYAIHVSLNDTLNTLDGFETITYHNHSPDTLPFIWIHLWPNAFKNDQTAYSEQKISDGQNDFYFSGNEEKGYINRLDFKVAGVSLLIEDHPQYIDIIKLVLSAPLLPGDSVKIHTPFHIKLPYRFSRPGYIGQHYSLTQWYPKTAVYDRNGWHPMPYLEWGEYYNDFGNYEVSITLPSNYVVAGTGTLLDENELNWMKSHGHPPAVAPPIPSKKELFTSKNQPVSHIPSSNQLKTLHFKADRVTDVAFFADKRFLVKYDTIQLNTAVVAAWNFVLPGAEKKWNNSMVYTKNAIRFYSQHLGEYPYPQVSLVGDPLSIYDGMEYPMISILNTNNEPQPVFDLLIAHETGHNWFQAIIATNERQYAWMDEGMNTYLEKKYRDHYYPFMPGPKGFIAKKLPADEYKALLDIAIATHTDQPIATPSEAFTHGNYKASAYEKTSRWLTKLELEIGQPKMQTLMQAWYDQWKFKHPLPGDFNLLAAEIAGHSLNDHFELLQQTGPITTVPKKNTGITGLFNLNNAGKKQYIGIAPAIGFNHYDKVALGALVHNYNLPPTPFRFVVVPLFATGSKQLVGYARGAYNFYPGGKLYQTTVYASAARFNTDNGRGLEDQKIFSGFSKYTPGIYLELKKKSPTSGSLCWLDIKTYIINERQLEHVLRPAPADTSYYDLKGGIVTTVIPQITLGFANRRVLYPWNVSLEIQQVKQIIRTSLDADYFLNYNAGEKGIAVRLFLGKILYTRAKTDLLRSQNSRYHFTMYGPNGYQDYTYSNAFAERNQSTALPGRQLMTRDGGFKYRSDYSAIQPGLKVNGIDFFDNWLAAVNLSIDIPNKLNPLSILPFSVPLKLFGDAGTSASPWEPNSELPKFLYSFGLELPLLKVIRVYYPIIQSKAFKEPNSINDPTRPGGPTWWQKRLTFSIDLQTLRKEAEKWTGYRM